MAFHLRTAGWTKVHPARLRGRWPAVLLTVGSVSILAGLALVAVSLAPMLGLGEDTSTVAPPPAVVAGDPTDIGVSGGVTTGLNVVTAPALVDRPVNGLAFTMQVPSLHYTAKVYEGIDKKTLLRGPGHYPTSAWPGRDGTVGVAAHNVYWLSFSRLKVGDRVQLQSAHGLYIYQITGSKITVASDVSVLGPGGERRLVLTTCYPLWAGAFATKRLVFFAREIGGVT